VTRRWLISCTVLTRFRRHRTMYLKGHLYANATTEDLWASISEASGRDVAKLMHNWTTKVSCLCPVDDQVRLTVLCT
jgi:hypothetical protein